MAKRGAMGRVLSGRRRSIRGIGGCLGFFAVSRERRRHTSGTNCSSRAECSLWDPEMGVQRNELLGVGDDYDHQGEQGFFRLGARVPPGKN